MRYLFSLAFVAFGLASLPAQAASPKGKDFYGAVYLGAVFLTQDTSWARGDAAQGVNPGAMQVMPTIRSRNVEVESDPGFDIGGAVGFWMNDLQRTEISVGYRSYEADLKPNRGLIADAMAADDDDADTTNNMDGDPNDITDPCGGDNDPANDPDTFCPAVSADIYVIPVMFNNYFYPLMPFDLIPEAHQPYFGFGVGIGLWSFDAPGFNDDYRVAVMLGATVGYDLYISDLLSDLAGMNLPAQLDSAVVGVAYQYSWSNPKPKADSANAVLPKFNNAELKQSSHAIRFNARYEF